MKKKALTLFTLLITLIQANAQKTLSQYLVSQTLFGKDSVTVHAFDRYDAIEVNTPVYYSNWLIETNDSFCIKRSDYTFQFSSIKFHDSSFHYFLVGTSNPLNFEGTSFMLPMAFTRKPSYFSVEAYLNGTVEVSQMCWLSTGQDSVTLGDYSFVTRKEPAMYHALINSQGEVENVGLSQDFVHYEPSNLTILDINPIRYTAEYEGVNERDLTNYFITSEYNILSDDTLTFLKNTSSKQGAGRLDFISQRLNSPDEVIATSSESILIRPTDTLSVIHGDTVQVVKNSHFENFHFFRKSRTHIPNKDTLISQHIAVLAPIGSEPNSLISNNSFVYWANGKRSIINDDTITHDSGVYIHVFSNTLGSYTHYILKTDQKLKQPITLKTDYFGEMQILINDFIDSCEYANKIKSFSEKDGRIVRFADNRYFDFLYDSCEVTAAYNTMWEFPTEPFTEIDYLYQIHNFSTSSFIKEANSWGSRLEVQSDNGFIPYYFFSAIRWDGSVDEINRKHVSIYPNPSSDKIHVVIEDGSNLGFTSYVIRNMEGQSIQEGKLLENQIQLKNQFVNGTYILTLNGEDYQYNTRIILIK